MTNPTNFQLAHKWLHDLLPDALLEALRASEKFPQPNYTISKFAEEAGEVHRGMIHLAEERYSAGELEEEIVQLLAMLMRIHAEGDQVHNLPSLRELL